MFVNKQTFQILMKFRAYLQGLRAFSILLVIFFHFFNLIPNGFLGVDTFFLISGFLVGGAVYTKLENNNFSISQFYYKRIIRIIPSQIFFIILAIPLILTLPIDFRSFHFKEILYSLISFSNIFYYRESGYFEASSDYKMFLHTWSLAVEEQFYLLLPISLMLIFYLFNRKNIRIYVLLLILIISLSLNFYDFNPNAKFYLLPFRLWEFLLGLSVFIFRRKMKIRYANILSITSFLLSFLILFTLLDISKTILTIIFVLNLTILFLILEYHTGKTIVKNILSSKPLQFIGNISYSLYLSHWFTFWVLRNLLDSYNCSLFYLCVYLFSSLCLSLFSYYQVEKRYRQIGFKTPENLKQYSFKILTVLVILVLYSFSIDRYLIKNEKTIDTLKAEKSIIKLNNKGGRVIKKEYKNSPKNPKIIFWGDSHITHLQFSKIWENYNIITYMTSGCPSLIGTYRKDEGNFVNCMDISDKEKILDDILLQDPDYIILINRYNLYASGYKKKGVLQDATHFIFDKHSNSLTQGSRINVIEIGLENTIKYFKEKSINIVLTYPTYDLSELGDPRDLYTSKQRNIPIEYLKESNQILDSTLNNISLKYKIGLLNSREIFVKNDTLSIYDPKKKRMLYRDDNHLNSTGGLIYTEDLYRQFQIYLNQK